jgi:hypothetical protein
MLRMVDTLRTGGDRDHIRWMLFSQSSVNGKNSDIGHWHQAKELKIF